MANTPGQAGASGYPQMGERDETVEQSQEKAAMAARSTEDRRLSADWDDEGVLTVKRDADAADNDDDNDFADHNRAVARKADAPVEQIRLVDGDKQTTVNAHLMDEDVAPIPDKSNPRKINPGREIPDAADVKAKDVRHVITDADGKETARLTVAEYAKRGLKPGETAHLV